ncbi:hypothetical protein [Mesorhizobium sp.]|uniref:phage tail protein n=1 Tax=Mesorhizobium sp. TaxID=1871066 RepID=UPI000FE99AC8|nr:hypothetical protein [Mesorhizobium sp.]RWC56290.1 MAG: hypothetical protein EOS56_24495 [Mesorhizobium sp.]RWC61717.1 MAG: hypothetical protein EOS29_17700 [Mesorhizobium sp.]
MVRQTSMLYLAAAFVLFAGTATAQEVGCTTVMDCAQKAMEAAFQAKTAIGIAVPKGAVMAFNLPECPEGWSEFGPLQGRSIVGAGAGTGLTERKVGESGGEETHKLTVDEMPSHSHPYDSESGVDGNRSGQQDATYNRIHSSTGAVGGDKPHNNMSPFFVLRYCERK